MVTKLEKSCDYLYYFPDHSTRKAKQLYQVPSFLGPARARLRGHPCRGSERMWSAAFCSASSLAERGDRTALAFSPSASHRRGSATVLSGCWTTSCCCRAAFCSAGQGACCHVSLVHAMCPALETKTHQVLAHAGMGSTSFLIQSPRGRRTTALSFGRTGSASAPSCVAALASSSRLDFLHAAQEMRLEGCWVRCFHRGCKHEVVVHLRIKSQRRRRRKRAERIVAENNYL